MAVEFILRLLEYKDGKSGLLRVRQKEIKQSVESLGSVKITPRSFPGRPLLRWIICFLINERANEFISERFFTEVAPVKTT